MSMNQRSGSKGEKGEGKAEKGESKPDKMAAIETTGDYPVPKELVFSPRFPWQRQNVFLKMMHDQAAITVAGMDALVAYMNNQGPECAKMLTTKEKQADEARRILISELNKTFITPFDREDIFGLSRAIDDVLDYAYSTVTEMEILKVKPTPYMARIATILRDAAYELLQAVDRLEKHPVVASEHAQRAKSLENRVEDIYREALADLFSGAEDTKHVIKILKQREVYRHMSNAADRGDEAANLIADIVVKMT